MNIKSVFTIGGFTFLSRISGFVRDILMTSLLGAGPVFDAFAVAFKFPNFFRRLFGEGALNAAFVPRFSGKLVSEDHAQAYRYAVQIFSVLAFFLCGFVLVVEFLMPWLMFVIAPGFSSTPDRMQLAIDLSRITFPYILFISLAAQLSGALNALDRFAAPAAAPIILNLVMIVSLVFFAQEKTQAGYALSYAVLLAGFLQFFWLWCVAWKLNFKMIFVKPTLSPEIKELIKAMVPGVIGAGVVQINLLIDVQIVSFLPTGSLAYLHIADRLNQLPLSVIGIAVSTALLPHLSKQLRIQEYENALKSQNRAIEFALLLTVPAAAALVVLSHSIMTLLFGHGAFTPYDVFVSSHVLQALALGLPAYVLIKILSTHFFAHHDTKTPVKVAIFGVVLNVIISLCLVWSLGVVGVGLATAISGWFNALALGVLLYRRQFFAMDDRLKRFLPRLVLSVFFMALTLFQIDDILQLVSQNHLWMQILTMLLFVSVGVLVFAFCGHFLGALNVRELKNYLRR